jgi:NAD(P)-dependent dehydrogenase (short-subunit alcohol dehydrogenase family)
MITGGVQGLGKGLAMEFAKRHEIGGVNFIILDIAENLAAEMIADMEQALGSKGK